MNEPILCPQCMRKKYFEGLCYSCTHLAQKAHYEAMSENEIVLAVEAVIQAVRQGKDVYQTDFMQLLAYCDIDTQAIADMAVKTDKGIFYPKEIYRNASLEVRDQLITLLLEPYCPNAGDVLCCLAEMGDDKVREVFFQLEHHPLPWRQNIFVNPSIYAQSGGWTFDEKGQKILLDYPVCYAIEETSDDALTVGEKIDGHCTVCGCQLVHILSFDGTDERLRFLGIDGKVKLPLCPNCASMSEKTVIRYQLDGEGSFVSSDCYDEENYLSAEDMLCLTSNKLGLSAMRKPLYHAYGFDELSIVGGHPNWIQDWQYERCPDCGAFMRMLAMLSWVQLIHSSEGNLYLEICTNCAVVVALHQQT